MQGVFLQSRTLEESLFSHQEISPCVTGVRFNLLLMR